MATYYVRTDGNNGNAGTTDSSGGAWLTLDYAATAVAAGDTIMVRASAGNASSYPTSSPDYTISSFFTPTAGSAGSGYVRWIGYNGTPTIASAGLGYYNCTFQYWENLYFYASSNGAGSFGILHAASTCSAVNVVLNTNSQAAMRGLNVGSGNCYFRGLDVTSGSASPTSSADADAVKVEGGTAHFHGCRLRYARAKGINQAGGTVVLVNSQVYKCVDNGVHHTGTTSTGLLYCIGNTIDGGSGHGIRIDGTNGAAYATIKNTIISNHTGGSKYGISVATASSDARVIDWGYNCLYNNTSNYENVSAASTDITSNPTYTDATNGDYTPTNSALRVAYPLYGDMPLGTSVTNHVWIGAIQPEEAAGGGGMVVHPGMGGGFRG